MKYFNYHRFIIAIILMFCFSNKSFGNNEKPVIYLIPGQGSDYRVFKNLQIDTRFEIRPIIYTIPRENMSLPEFAKELSSQIDTTKSFILIGVSLGGMIATEMSYFLNPDKIILISSAKCRNELPKRYKFQRKFPIYTMVSGKTAKKGAKIMQPVVEPDRNNEKEICKSMLEDKDPDFLKRTIKMIMEWERIDYPETIIHIHGDNDHTAKSGESDHPKPGQTDQGYRMKVTT
jgi:pimeloyl-ACP methyl ester carboxylesterase